MYGLKTAMKRCRSFLTVRKGKQSMSWLDLHMHSEVSLDGEYSPKQLAGLCHEKGLKVAALSDHNSVRGVEEMMVSCARFGIRGIPAVELDCTFDGVDLHLLGYGIDYRESRYAELEKQDTFPEKRKIPFCAMKILGDIGIIFEEEKVLAPFLKWNLWWRNHCGSGTGR